MNMSRYRQILGASSMLLCLLLLPCRPPFVLATGSAVSQSPQAPTIWHDPGNVESLDFAHGAGGEANVPAPPFTFIEEDSGGSNPKIKVKDAAGRHWGVKWGSEVNAETIASCRAWAAGYYVESSYYVASRKIVGANGLGRAKKYVANDGSFTKARFELKEDHIHKKNQEEGWRWDRNPFLGTKELNGLKIMLML